MSEPLLIYHYVSISCVTTSVVPGELQCSVATFLLCSQQKPVLMIVNRRKRSAVSKSILYRHTALLQL